MSIVQALFGIQQWYLSTFVGIKGFYSPYLQEYYCENERACKHEQGHQEDHSFGWYSRTEEFQQSLKIIASCKKLRLKQLPFIQNLFGYLEGKNEERVEEIYATIYSIVDLEDYNSLRDLLRNYVQLCTTISIVK